MDVSTWGGVTASHGGSRRADDRRRCSYEYYYVVHGGFKVNCMDSGPSCVFNGSLQYISIEELRVARCQCNDGIVVAAHGDAIRSRAVDRDRDRDGDVARASDHRVGVVDVDVVVCSWGRTRDDRPGIDDDRERDGARERCGTARARGARSGDDDDDDDDDDDARGKEREGVGRDEREGWEARTTRGRDAIVRERRERRAPRRRRRARRGRGAVHGEGARGVRYVVGGGGTF